MDFYDEVYYSLIGELEPRLAGVPNAFAVGSPCDQAYARLLAARDRLLERLGREEDPDLEEMLQAMDLIQRELCRTLLAVRRM